MQQRTIDGDAPKQRSWWQRIPLYVWLMIAFFVTWPALLAVFINQPMQRASPAVRARLEPMYEALQRREADARADHPQVVPETGPGDQFKYGKMRDALGRHALRGDKDALLAVESYEEWVTSLESDHSAAKRAELDDTDRKRENKTHHELTAEIDTRLSARPTYAPPQEFYDHPWALVVPALLFPAIIFAAFGPTVRDALQRRRLKRIGVPMMGTILSAQSTGVSINRVPQLLMRVRLETGEDAEYRKLSQYGSGIGAGTPVQLLVDPRDHTKVTEA